jgi:aryl-alcohol dehydrogenase-like predicted oxidoreductase
MADQAIPRRKLGRTKMEVTEVALGGVGLGGMRTADEDATAAATVQRAWEQGINYLDTSPLYGDSERRIGLAFQKMGGRPYGLYLSTKTGTHPARRGDYSAEGTRWSVENSLKLLGVSAVDLLLVHDPDTMDPVLAPGAALDTLEKMRGEGKFRWIGLGVREHDKLRTAIRTGRFDAILTYRDYNLIRQTAAPLIDEAHAAGVGVILAQVFVAGLLAGVNPADTMYANQPEARLASEWWFWARERSVNLRAIALQYGLRNPKVGTVLVGADTPDQVDEIVGAAQEPIPLDIWEEVEERIRRQKRG